MCVALEASLNFIAQAADRSDSLFQFSIRVTTAGLDMVDGLCHVAKRMEWYMLLHTLLLERAQPSSSVPDCRQAELRDSLKKSIQELYYSLLMYEIQCVCYCYRDSVIVKALRVLVTLDDWKGKYSSKFFIRENSNAV